MAIWIIPVLGVLDVATTFYISSLGYPLEEYEIGFFASYFARMGLLPYYVPVYLAILFAFSFIFWRIKNALDSSSTMDKFVFGLLIFALCFIYGKISTVIASNVLLPHYYRLPVPIELLSVLIFVVCVFQIVLFIKDDFVEFYRVKEIEEGELK